MNAPHLPSRFAHPFANRQDRRANRIGSLLAILVMTFSFSAMGGGISAAAQIGGNSSQIEARSTQAYVWANQPSADSYTPNEMYQYNSEGHLNTVTRTGAGAYTVDLPGMTDGGNTQVTATSGSDSGIAPGQVCAIAAEPQGTQQFVACTDAEGNPTDTGFSLLHTAGDVFLGWNGAFVFGYDRSTASYTPEGSTNFNVTGTPNTIERLETGIYLVTMPGLGYEEGNVQVTPVNLNGEEAAGTNCTAGNWNLDDTSSKTVTVMCFDPAGELADSEFFLLYATGQPVAGNTEAAIATSGAYAFVNDAAAETGESVTPDADFQFNSTGGENTVIHTATGTYEVTFPGLAAESGVLQVTPAGTGTGEAPAAVGCSVLTTGTVDSDLVVTLHCFDGDGELADTRFNVLYVDVEAAAEEEEA